MKFFLIVIIAFAFMLSSCNKDDESLKMQTNKSSNTVVGSGKHLKDGFEIMGTDEIINAVQTFQNDRKDFRENNTCSDYTLQEALFRMPLVMNFELGGYGYFSDFETSETKIIIANNGTTEEGETIISGSDMFDKYSDVEYYINNQIGDLKLFNADFTVKEKDEEHTVITVSITAGVLNSSSFGHEVSNEFPVIPINTNPNCLAAGQPSYVANAFTAAYNSIPVSIWFCRPINQILVNYGPAWIAPDPSNTSTHFVYHNNWPDNIAAQTYNNDYYNWVNNNRLYRITSGVFAKEIRIDYYYYDPNLSNWFNFKARHIISIAFGKYEYIPDLFNVNGPKIP